MAYVASASICLPLVAICSLALGIGANTAIFSLINAVLLDHAVSRAGAAGKVWEDGSAVGSPRNNPAPGTYSDWKEQQSSSRTWPLLVGEASLYGRRRA